MALCSDKQIRLDNKYLYTRMKSIYKNCAGSNNIIIIRIVVPKSIYLKDIYYRTRRNFRGGLIFVLFAGEVDPRKLMRTKIKNDGPSP